MIPPPDRAPPTLLLLVDDEPHILSSLRRALRREGYRILAATAPSEALRLLDAEPVDAILSDHRMPGMSGLDLLAAAACRRPAAARLLITGWPHDIPRERLAKLGIRALIPKPWDDDELKRTLREALAR